MMTERKIYTIFRVDDPNDRGEEHLLGIVDAEEKALGILSILVDEAMDTYNFDSRYDKVTDIRPCGCFKHAIDLDFQLFSETYGVEEMILH